MIGCGIFHQFWFDSLCSIVLPGTASNIKDGFATTLLEVVTENCFTLNVADGTPEDTSTDCTTVYVRREPT